MSIRSVKETERHYQIETPEAVLEIFKDHPHGPVLKAYLEQFRLMYGETEADRQFLETGTLNIELHADRNYMHFIVAAKKSGNPIETRIKNIYRTRGPDGKEYLFWSGQLRCVSKHGEPIATSVAGVGHSEVPQFAQRYSKTLEEWSPSLEVIQTKALYTIEWNKKNIDKLSECFYDDGARAHTDFYFVDYGGRKQNSPKEITIEQWQEWWKTLPRKDMLSKLSELASKTSIPPGAMV